VASRDPIAFRIDLARKMAEQVRERVRTLIESDTLKRSLEIRVTVNGTEIGADIFLPQYWAVYYHDGRGPVRPINGKFLVYFADIEDDPRVSGGRNYPIHASQIRRLRLDPAEFRRLVKSGKLIVRESVGPAKAHPFFERLAGRAAKIVAPTVAREMRSHLLGALADVRHLRGTLRFRPFG